MSTESERILHVHKYLSRMEDNIIKWKIRSDFTAGTPDAYYCGPAGSLWIEYKSVKLYTKKGIIKPKLSELQARWLNKQWEFEKNAWAIILGPERIHYIFQNPSKWDDPLICTGYEEVALRILDKISPKNIWDDPLFSG